MTYLTTTSRWRSLIRGAFLSDGATRLSRYDGDGATWRAVRVSSRTRSWATATASDARRLRDSIATGCCCGRGLRDTLRPLRCGEKTLGTGHSGSGPPVGPAGHPSLMIRLPSFSLPRRSPLSLAHKHSTKPHPIPSLPQHLHQHPSSNRPHTHSTWVVFLSPSLLSSVLIHLLSHHAIDVSSGRVGEGSTFPAAAACSACSCCRRWKRLRIA